MRREQYPWQLPPEIERRLGDSTYGRQRAIYEAKHLLLILHTPPLTEDYRREIRVFLRAPDGKLLCNGRENGEPRLRQLLDAYQQVFDKYETAHDKAQTADELFPILEGLVPAARAAIHLREALQSARELVREDKFLIAMRDEAYEVARNLELLLADAKTALDCRIARNAEAQAARGEEMAAAQHKLNVLAAVTFPLMALATIFGMNLVHGMEGRTPLLFWGVFVVGLIVGTATRGWVMRTKDAKDVA